MTALLAPFPKFVAEDNAGATLPGALLYTYAAGTTTPLATYTDSTGATPNANPVVCDSAGRANVWLTAGTAYKFVLQNSSGVVQWTVDNITGGLQGADGDAGSTWRDGTGTPSNALGVNGDYYLDTNAGDVYKKALGSYGVVGNIKGPAGSSINRIVNGTFYASLLPWATTGTDTVTLGTGRTAITGAAQMLASQSISVAVTKTGSISQGFSVQSLSGTQNLTFATACYYESLAALTANSGTVKIYFYDATGGTETLIGTYNLTATSSTPTWVDRTIDVTAYMPTLGDYGIRCELTAYVDNAGGAAGSKGTIVAVEDFKLVTSSAGTAGPTGPTGPAGPAGSSSGVQQKTTITATQTFTVPVSINYLDVTCVGAGGGGGGAGTDAGGGGTQTGGGGGGGGGATVRRRIPVTPNTGYTVTIGSKGLGSSAGTAGTNGGDTSFGTLVVAKGGSGGGSTTGTGVGAAGAAGTGSINDLTGSGTINPTLTATPIAILFGDGAAVAGGPGGAGGSGVGTNAGAAGTNIETRAGGTGGTATASRGGGGGGGASAFGAGGAGGNSSGAPSSPAAGNYGAGGGGGGGKGASASPGADGSNGICIIEWVG